MKGYLTRRKKAWYIILEPQTKGKRKQQWVSVRKALSLTKPATKAQAEGLLIKLLSDMQQGVYVAPHYMTVEQLLDEWMSSDGKANLRPTTYGVYEAYIKNHLVPSIGDIPIAQLKAPDLQRMYTQKLTSGKMDGTGGLSPASVTVLHKIMSRALGMGVRWELLSRNVAELVQPPQIAKTPRETWTAEQALYFISTLGEHPLRALFMLAIYAGMRKSELLGLRWQDVDYDRSTVSIVQTIVQTSHGAIVGQAKTAAGRRSVQIAGEVVLALRRQRTEQAKLAAHLAMPLPSLVFTTRHLTNIGPNNLLRDFKRLSRQAGLPQIPFHALRHTHATILLQQGVHPKVVSERLGHSRTGVTMDVYSHVLPDSQAQAVTAFDKAMKKV